MGDPSSAEKALRFGKDGVRVSELSDEALWAEVKMRRAKRNPASFRESSQRPVSQTSSFRSQNKERNKERNKAPAKSRESVAQWYANLELESGASLEKVREAYERLCHQFRPEQHADDPEKYAASKQLVGSLNHAYESLSAYLKR